jgi:hypothetical protein
LFTLQQGANLVLIDWKQSNDNSKKHFIIQKTNTSVHIYTEKALLSKNSALPTVSVLTLTPWAAWLCRNTLL